VKIHSSSVTLSSERQDFTWTSGRWKCIG